jgi:ATP-dependent DNA ligase
MSAPRIPPPSATPLVPETNCGTLLFKDLCLKFEKMLKLSKSQQKLLLIFNKELKEVLNGQSMFPLMRLLLPLNDSHRQKYGVKQTTVANTYIEALHLNKSSADASRLKFWKNPTRLNATVSKVGSGDFTSILEDVLRTRISLDLSNVTLREVNEILDELAATKDKIELIRTKILNRFSALEQKWLMRIVFQDMKIGLKYEQVLNHISPSALQRYNECTDLRLVCSEIALAKLTTSSSSSSTSGGASQTATRGINVFTCFYPMLAKGFPNTGQIVEVEAAMQGHPFVMDLKLDGDRMLCHISNGKGMFWSRNGTDYSATYASLLEDIVRRVNCRSCIIDGEVCAWDDENKTFIPFGHNRTVARMEDEERKLSQDHRGSGGGRLSLDEEDDAQDPNFGKRSCHLVYIMFDVIYLQDLRIDNRVIYDLSTLPFLSREALVLGTASHSLSSSALAAQDKYSKDLNESFDRFDKNHFTSDILHFPLLIRRALLPYLVSLQEKRIEIVRSEAVFSHSLLERKARLENFFNRVSVEGEEGLVVKDGLSPYLLGMRSRQSQSWVKMKPEYSDLTRDLDLVILGAYYGEGNSMRGKGLSTFLLGIRDDSDAGSAHTITPPSSLSSSQQSSSQLLTPTPAAPLVKYRSICKVGTGYSFQELEELRSKISPFIVPWDQNDKQRLPPHFTYWRIGKSDDVPDVWIPPEKSFLVELKCAEIVTSDQFSAGITCRFPRLRKIRYDKNVTEVMTLSDIYQILKQPRLKNRVARNGEEEGEGGDGEEAGGKKRGGGRGKKNKLLESSLKYRENIVASHFSLPPSATATATSGGGSGEGTVSGGSFRALGSLDVTNAKRKLHQSCAERVLCVLENEYTVPSDRYDMLMETQSQSRGEREAMAELLGWTEDCHSTIKLNRVEVSSPMPPLSLSCLCSHSSLVSRVLCPQVINLILATGGEVVANPTPSSLVITGDKRCVPSLSPSLLLSSNRTF